MSERDRKVGRGSLFDVFRRALGDARSAHPAREARFDLEAFYRRRADDGETSDATIPEIRVRDLRKKDEKEDMS